MRNQNGVNMIELVLVIIILIIIATFSVFTGRETVDQASITEVYTEINSIRNMVNSANIEKELDSYSDYKKGEHYNVKVSEKYNSEEEFEATYGFNVPSGDYEKLYIIYGMDDLGNYEGSKVKDHYGLDSIKHTYLVNFEKVEVDLLKPIILADRAVRTFEQIRNLVEDGNF